MSHNSHLSSADPSGWDQLFNTYQEVGIAESSGRHRLNKRRSVLRLVPKGRTGAEIGVFTGLFAPILAEVCKPKKLFLVDPWDKLHGSHFPNWGAYTNHVRVPTAGAQQAAAIRAKEMDCDCEVVKEFSTEWLKSLSPNALDWVYLDASHKFEDVVADLKHIDTILSDDGIILGDDCWISNNGQVGEIYNALYAFCEHEEYALLHLDEYGQWAIKRKRDIVSRR
ncbi:class I SAM-dependent methyltransferase [Paracoccus alkanivorans]|uniref:class I SAM-dependent methyltransferase n=1 Tax=Paracoccus alkanivorans TaxID=2116655 RepID=UPI001409D1F9|nr:class I SAM-dependent methyltransferase [Paracoccus alkanivorans]